MDKPTLLIGIGTSGLRVLEHVQNFFYESTGKNRPENVQYLYLETDENAYPGVTALKNEIARVHISLNEKETMINALEKDDLLDAWWLPPSNQIMDSGFGAGGLPAFGRVALWGRDNFEKVSTHIKNAFEKVGSHTVEGSDDSKPAVFVTGSLTGGTGTGVFIDMAYLIRDILRGIDDLYGLFMIPGRQGFAGKEVIYANTYAGLMMLDHYNKKENDYRMRWPNGHNVHFEEPPYEYTQFISQDYNGNVPSISSLGGLYKMAGLYLFLNAFGLRKKRLVRFGDAKGNLHLDKYGTFGLSAIQYPKSQLEEHLSIQLGEELLGRWTDPEYYYRQGTKTPVSRTHNAIVNGTKKKFERFLREAFDELNGTEVEAGRKVLTDIDVQTQNIRNKNYDAASDLEHIQSRFSSNVTANYYTAIKNNLRVAEDVLIERIAELISHATERYENLYVVREHLIAVVDAINETVQYWQSLKVSGKPDRWEVMLNNQTRWMLKNRYKILLQADQVLADRMRTTLELMKMHLFANKLVDIRNSITKGELAIRSIANVELPRLKQVDNMIRVIRETLGTQQDNKLPRDFKTLKGRRQEIEQDISDTTIPILRIFPSGTVDDELQRSMERFRRASNNTIPGKEAMIGKEDLWSYLNQASEGMHKRLYRDSIRSFERQVRKHNAVPNMDVSEYIRKEPTESIKIARRATYPLVKINSDKQTMFGQSMYVPKMVIGQNMSMISKALEHFKDEKYLDFQGDEDGTWVNEDLQNMLVFYEEKGYMQDKTNFEPLKHLQFIDEVKKLYYEYPGYKSISPEDWHRLRVPYFKYRKQIENV
ncbi:MAG: tubulin-like doman-containing protein [Cyclobacteriaceae bacterium]